MVVEGGWPTGPCREFVCRISRSCVCGFRVTFAATNYANALTSPNNSCHSSDSLAPHLAFAPHLPDCYLSTPSSLQLSAFE